jgi:hypothetical protein
MRLGSAILAGAFCVTGACSEAGDTAAPTDAPSQLQAGPLGGGVHLTWRDNSQAEQRFEIERKESGASFALLDTVPFDTALYHDANVTLGVEYTYRVRAQLESGYSAYSNEASADPGEVASGGTSSIGGTSTASGGASASGAAGGRGGGALGGASSSGGANAGGTTAAGGAASGSGGTAPGGAAGSGNSRQVSFKTDVVPALVKSCGSTTSGCHNSDQAVGRNLPQFGPCKVIWYSAVDAPVGATYTSGPNQGQPTGCPDLDLYARLTTLHSMLCDAPSWQARPQYVVPGNLDKSLLYQVIAGDPSMGGTCKSMDMNVRKMPLVDPKVLPNGVELGAAGIVTIRDWILQGAKNN